MSRMQLKARAARAIFQRMREADGGGEPVLGSYQDVGMSPVHDLELVILRDVERVGPEGMLVVDQVQISVLAEQLPKVRREGIFTAPGQRWRVTEPVRNDGVIVTAAVMPA